MARLNTALGPRLAWEAQRLISSLGWPLLAGAAGLGLAAFSVWQVQRLLVDDARLRTEIAQVRTQTPPPPAPRDGDRLAAFYARLPAHANLPDQLKTLHALAAKQGIVLAKADYRLRPEEQAPFLRYEIALPIHAEHAQLQAFLLSALKTLPNLTLDQISFKRAKDASTEVEARVAFVLLVQKAVRK